MKTSLSIKSVWDPANIFNHCQSVASDQTEGQVCCPFSSSSSPSPSSPPSLPSPASPLTAGGCLTQTGAPCVFPFTWQGITHRSCTKAGGFSVAWCSTRTDGAGTHQTGHYGDCDTQTDCALEDDCRTVRSVLTRSQIFLLKPNIFSGAKPGLKCVFPFRYGGETFSSCVSAGFDQPWCSTKTSQGAHVTGHWGNCDPNTCPVRAS